MEFLKIDDLEVLTESGFQNFDGIKITKTSNLIELSFSDGSNLVCTMRHLIKVGDQFKEAFILKEGEVVNNLTITSIDYIHEDTEVYDLTNVENGEEYITNGVTSHNCAFVENWEEFAAGVLPTISSGETTRMIYTSTPNSLNHFYYYYQNAKNETSDFKLVEVPWWEVPGRDEKWKQKALADLNFDQQKFDVEYCVEFIGSSGTLISGATLKTLKPLNPIRYDVHLKQFAEPVKTNSYVMTVDVSRGKGLDYSAFQIIDVTKIPHQQVCTYRNNMITPSDFAQIVYRMATHYNNAQLLVEINDLGQQVVDEVFNMEYENILYTESKGRAGKQISFRGGANVDRGMMTTQKTKLDGCHNLKLLIEQQKLIINESETISELNTFSEKGKSYEAEPGRHDDMVMCLVLFAWLTAQQFFKEITDIDMAKVLRERSDEQLASELLPFGFVFDGRDEEYAYEIPLPEVSFNW